jgi:hypothetical protein
MMKSTVLWEVTLCKFTDVSEEHTASLQGVFFLGRLLDLDDGIRRLTFA